MAVRVLKADERAVILLSLGESVGRSETCAATKGSSPTEKEARSEENSQAIAAMERVAFSPSEFAALFGKEQTWGYRQIYKGKVKTITEYGRILIPAKEVERILGKAGVYNGVKPKISKPGKKLEAWRRFIAERRQAKKGSAKAPNGAMPSGVHSAGGNAREAALARLTKRLSRKAC